MPICDDVFQNLGIPFEAGAVDQMVYTIYRLYGRQPHYAKWLILCWFDQTFGHWNGTSFQHRNAREQMSAWLEKENYASFEELEKLSSEESNVRQAEARSKSQPADN